MNQNGTFTDTPFGDVLIDLMKANYSGGLVVAQALEGQPTVAVGPLEFRTAVDVVGEGFHGIPETPVVQVGSGGLETGIDVVVHARIVEDRVPIVKVSGA